MLGICLTKITLHFYISRDAFTEGISKYSFIQEIIEGALEKYAGYLLSIFQF